MEVPILHLLSQSTSWAAKLFGVIGLDTRPYCWSVFDEAEKSRGLFTAEYMARGASLNLDGTSYRMQRLRRGLLDLSFTLTASTGEQLASAVSGERRMMTRKIAPRIGDDVFTFSVERERCTLAGADHRVVGTLDIERGSWTIRECNGHVRFDGSGISDAAQVFLFWLSIYQDLNTSDVGG